MCLTVLLANYAGSTGYWLSEQNVSQSSSDSLLSKTGFGSNHTGIAVDSSGNPHAVWFSGSPSAIYYSRKTGNAWLPSVTITVATAMALFPSLAIDTNNRLHLVWHDYRNAINQINGIEIYYNTTTVDGLWNNETRLTYKQDVNNTNGDNSYFPTIVVDPKNDLNVLWYDFHWNGYRPDLAYMTATSGFSWNTTQSIDSDRITFTTLYESPIPDLCTDTASNIHVVWFSDSTGNLGIYYKMKSAITGLWSADTLISNSTASAIDPAIVSDSRNNLYVFWSDSRNGNYAIYMKEYSVDSHAWLPDQQLSNGSGSSNHPAATVDKQNNIHLVWDDNRNGYLQIFYKKFDASSQSWLSDVAISTGTASSQYPSIVADSFGNVHVLWQDSRTGNQQIFYRMQSNVTGIEKKFWDVYE